MFVLFAFLSLSCAYFAQDLKAQSEGTLLIAPRFDVDPAYSVSDKAWTVDLGTTSFYTFFDGNIGEHFSFSLGNHWLSFSDLSFDSTRDLYRNTWRADALNWVDWANVTFSYSGFFLSLGKDAMRIGTYEIDEYDYLSHWQINSVFWNSYQVYQWGGRFGWTNEDEDTMFSLSVTTDQLQEKPFSGDNFDQYAITLTGMHDFDNVSLLASLSHCSLGVLGALGLNINFTDDFALEFGGYGAREYAGGNLKLLTGIGEKFDFFAKCGYDWGDSDDVLGFSGSRFYTGAGCYWYPIKENRDLKVHGLFSYDSGDNSLGLSFGLTYSLNLNIF